MHTAGLLAPPQPLSDDDLGFDDLPLLVDNVRDYAIFMLDPQGRVRTWNAGAQCIKGYAPHEIIGRHFSDFYSSEDRLARKPEKELEIATREGRVEDEGWRVRKDGSRFWANVVITALFDKTGKLRGFGKVTRDLTERRRAEETDRQLLTERVARAAAEEAGTLKDEFLATVSHELRTPLNAIIGWASLLRADSSPSALAKGLDVIFRNGQAQAKLIDDILDASRIITGKLKLELEATDLCAVVQDAMEVVRPSASAKTITITLNLPPHACLLIADRQRLQQVVWNLLSNAVKFTPAGGAIQVTVDDLGNDLELSIRDSGCGIEPEFLPYVFDRFKQADSSTTRRVGGLGLGLAIVRQIVELHGGRASAQSAGKGAGAAFLIQLPRRAAVPALQTVSPPSRHPDDAESRANVALRGLRVLVVDDDPDARDLLQLVLETAGAVVQPAASASAALALLRDFRPQLLVSDVGMPGEDGYSLMRKLRAAGETLPAVALTAYIRGEDHSKALTAGFNVHVGKPVWPDELLATIADLTARVPLRDG